MEKWYYISIFASFADIIQGNGHGSVWRINPKNEPRNIPINGGQRVDFRQWDDGEPQRLTFSMRVPDRVVRDDIFNTTLGRVPLIGGYMTNWSKKNPTEPFHKFVGNIAETKIKMPLKNRYTWRYDAYLGVGEAICGAQEISYNGIEKILDIGSDEHEQEIYNLGDEVGYFAKKQDTAAFKNHIVDTPSLLADLEMQTACIFITCRGEYEGGFVRRITDKDTCPVIFTGSWRKGNMRPSISGIKLGHLSEKAKLWTTIRLFSNKE